MIRSGSRGVRRAFAAAVGAAILLAGGLTFAQGGWTCRGSQSANCSLRLIAQGCPSDRQVCDSSTLSYFNTGDLTGCACLNRCTTSIDCQPGEACIPGTGYCSAKFGCNSGMDCPRDAICSDGVCVRPPPSCRNNNDCPMGAQQCIGGRCVAGGPTSCTADVHCGTDPCDVPRRCDLSTNRCVITGPRPCAGMPDARCVDERGAARCLVPACTSDAHCSSDPCAGTPQRCNVASGRCEPGDVPCPDGSTFCTRVANAPSLAYCAPRRPDPLAGGRVSVDRIDPDDLEIIWTPDPSGARPGRGGYVIVAWLPAGAAGEGARPANLSIAIAGSDRGLVVDGELAPAGRSARWVRDSTSGGWRWKRESSAGSVDSATLAPVRGRDGRLRLEVRGRALAIAPSIDPSKLDYAARVAVDWAGASARSTEISAALVDCQRRGEAGRTRVVCSGRPAK